MFIDTGFMNVKASQHGIAMYIGRGAIRLWNFLKITLCYLVDGETIYFRHSSGELWVECLHLSTHFVYAKMTEIFWVLIEFCVEIKI